MNSARPSKFDSLLLLSIGLLTGLLIAFCVYLVQAHNAAPVSTDAALPSSQPIEAAAPTPQSAVRTSQESPPYQQVSEAAAVAASPATPAQDAVAPSALVSSQLQTQQTAAGEQMVQSAPDGTTSTSVVTMSPESGQQYVFTSPAYQGNPSWTVTRNGLIGNPPVDPPSSKGRAYQTGDSY